MRTLRSLELLLRSTYCLDCVGPIAQGFPAILDPPTEWKGRHVLIGAVERGDLLAPIPRGSLYSVGCLLNLLNMSFDGYLPYRVIGVRT